MCLKMKKIEKQKTEIQVVKILKEAKLSRKNLTIDERKAIKELQHTATQ